MLRAAEKELKLRIPEDYRWFLKKYGNGGLGGVTVFGMNRLREMEFVEATKGYRNMVCHNTCWR
jgi:hypothetical protein